MIDPDKRRKQSIERVDVLDAHGHSEPGRSSTERRNGRLAAWFQRWRAPIRRWLARRSSVPPADIDDLAQEVFLRLLRYSDDVAVDNPQAYLFRITVNVANEWRERSRQRLPHDESWLEELQIEPLDEPENAADRAFSDARVRKAVDALAPRHRETLLLHVNEGLTYAQIAQRKGLTYRMVLRDLTHAYSELRLSLETDIEEGGIALRRLQNGASRQE